MPWDLKYYRTADGSCPLKDFLDDRLAVSKEASAKARAQIDVFIAKTDPKNYRRYPNQIRFLGDDLHDSRTKSGKVNVRIFFRVYGNRHQIIFTHGTVKKTKKIDPEEIKRAKTYLADWEMRNPETSNE